MRLQEAMHRAHTRICLRGLTWKPTTANGPTVTANTPQAGESPEKEAEARGPFPRLAISVGFTGDLAQTAAESVLISSVLVLETPSDPAANLAAIQSLCDRTQLVFIIILSFHFLGWLHAKEVLHDVLVAIIPRPIL